MNRGYYATIAILISIWASTALAEDYYQLQDSVGRVDTFNDTNDVSPGCSNTEFREQMKNCMSSDSPTECLYKLEDASLACSTSDGGVAASQTGINVAVLSNCLPATIFPSKEVEIHDTLLTLCKDTCDSALTNAYKHLNELREGAKSSLVVNMTMNTRGVLCSESGFRCAESMVKTAECYAKMFKKNVIDFFDTMMPAIILTLKVHSCYKDSIGIGPIKIGATVGCVATSGVVSGGLATYIKNIFKIIPQIIKRGFPCEDMIGNTEHACENSNLKDLGVIAGESLNITYRSIVPDAVLQVVDSVTDWNEKLENVQVPGLKTSLETAPAGPTEAPVLRAIPPTYGEEWEGFYHALLIANQESPTGVMSHFNTTAMEEAIDEVIQETEDVNGEVVFAEAGKLLQHILSEDHTKFETGGRVLRGV